MYIELTFDLLVITLQSKFTLIPFFSKVLDVNYLPSSQRAAFGLVLVKLS